MNSRVHPNYKTNYRVTNWAEYDRALVRRGDITLWISEDAIAAWKPTPTGRRGAQQKFSDHAIETALTLRQVFPAPGPRWGLTSDPYPDLEPKRSFFALSPYSERI
jgi:hypothetical protein